MWHVLVDINNSNSPNKAAKEVIWPSHLNCKLYIVYSLGHFTTVLIIFLVFSNNLSLNMDQLTG